MSSTTQTQHSIRTRVRHLIWLPIHALHILVLLLAGTAYDLIYRVSSMRKAGTCLQLPRVIAAEVNLADLMRRRRPVVLKGLAEQLGLEHSLDLSSLWKMSAKVNEKFQVKHYKTHSPYFLYTGDYGRELDYTSEMSLETFLHTMFDAGGPKDHAIYQMFGRRSLKGEIGSLINQIAEGLAGVAEGIPEKGASGVWIGSEGVVTPLHLDAWPGLLFQLHGAKKVLMFSPQDAQNLYFNSPFSVGDRWSRLPGQSRNADPIKFPRITRATRYEAHLQSGEVLYIPPFWLHEIESLEPNISIPFRFKVQPRDYFHPRILRALFENFYKQYRHLADPVLSK